MSDHHSDVDPSPAPSVDTTTASGSSRQKLKSFYAQHKVSIPEDFFDGPEKSTTTDDAEKNSSTTLSSSGKKKFQPPFRFIRLNPRFDRQETLQLLKQEVGAGNNNDDYPIPVPWIRQCGCLDDEPSDQLLPPRLDFYALPGDFGLSKSPCFQSGRVYGQDVSSGAAVAALLSSSNRQRDDDSQGNNNFLTRQTPLRILDLCCAPGLKLCAMADWFFSSWSSLSSSLGPSPSTASPAPNDKANKNGGNGVASFPHSGEGDDDEPDVVIVGVDNSQDRLAVCKKILRKYQQDDNDSISRSNVRIRLYCNDGTAFGLPQQQQQQTKPLLNLVFDSKAAAQEDNGKKNGKKRKRMNKSARARERKRLAQMAHLDIVDGCCGDDGDDVKNKTESSFRQDAGVGLQLFDRVMVDAECSTDGSLIHVQKQIQALSNGKKPREPLLSTKDDDEETTTACTAHPQPPPPPLVPLLTDHEQFAKLVQLQQKLAASGFRLLKEGGFMVYSTCSLSKEQNEGVVAWLLKEHANARIVPVDFDGTNGSSRRMIVPGTIAGTLRFLPNTAVGTPSDGGTTSRPIGSSKLFGGGFFLAKIEKVSSS